MMVRLLWTVSVGLLLLGIVDGRANCPCEKPEYCDPITTDVKHEVFVFSVSNSTEVWRRFDWNKTTTVAMLGSWNPEQLCLAHKMGARVITMADYPLSSMLNATYREQWIQHYVEFIKDHFMDGLNIDFEESIPKHRKDLIDGYTELVRQSTLALKSVNPNYKVSVDVPYGPNCVYERCFDYVGLAKASDYLIIMAYDEWSSSQSHGLAGANCNYMYTKTGVHDYMQAGIPASKLLLAVPWYGYIFPCKSLSLDQRNCSVYSFPYTGEYGSDAGIKQFNYTYIKEVILPNSPTGRRFDDVTMSPYFNLQINGQEYQVWYDDQNSLPSKYQIATSSGILGVGMWVSEGVDFTTDPLDAQMMWNILPNYN